MNGTSTPINMGIVVNPFAIGNFKMKIKGIPTALQSLLKFSQR